MTISYEGAGQLCVIMRRDEDVTAGIPCVVTKNDCVSIADAEDQFAGVVANVNGSLASVIVRGFVTVAYSGPNPTAGICKLLADGNGKVMKSDAGRDYLVTCVDMAGKTVTFLL